MNLVPYFAGLAGLLLLQLVFGWLALHHLARRLRAISAAQQRAASTDVPTSMLVTGIAQVEARLQRLERAQQPAARVQPGNSAYQLAKRMANDGADAAQIAEACGITVHEAELLARLHAPAR